MKVQDCTPREEYKTKKFIELCRGEAFLPQNRDELFIKIIDVQEYNHTQKYNAISLEDGLLSHFDFDDKVFTVDGIFTYRLLTVDKKRK